MKYLIPLFLFFSTEINAQTNVEKRLIAQITGNKIEDSIKAQLYIDYGNIVMDYDVNKAIEIFYKALDIANKTDNNGTKSKSYHSLSLCNSIIGRLQLAKVNGEAAYNYGLLSTIPQYIFQSSVQLADVNIDLLNYSKAKELLDVANEIYTKKYNILKTKGMYASIMGKYYLRNFNFSKAIEVYKQGLETCEKEKDFEFAHSLEILLGQMYFFKAKPDSSFYFLNKAIKYYKAKKDYSSEGNAYQAISIGYTLSNNLKKSTEYVDKAIDLYSIANNYPKLLECLMGKANSNYRTGNFYECVKILKRVEPILSKVENPAAGILLNLYNANIYAMANDSAKYLYYIYKAEGLVKSSQFNGFNNLLNMAKVNKHKKNLNIDSITAIENEKVFNAIGKDLYIANIEPLISNPVIFEQLKKELDSNNYLSDTIGKTIINNYDANAPITIKLNEQMVNAEVDKETSVMLRFNCRIQSF